MNLFPQAFKEQRFTVVPSSKSETTPAGLLPPIGKVNSSNSDTVKSRPQKSPLKPNPSPRRPDHGQLTTTTMGESMVNISDYAPDPGRRVYLTTFDKKNPMRRIVREIRRREEGQGGAPLEDNGSNTAASGVNASSTQHGSFHHNRTGRGGGRAVPSTQQDVLREEIYSLGSHTDEFIDFLRKLPKQSAGAIALVRQRMRAEGIRMNTLVYNLLMENICDMPGDGCYTIYEEMRRSATPPFLQPNVQTYRVLFRACERNSQFEAAFTYYAHMRAVPGLRPDVGMFNALIGYCSLLGDESQAAFLVEEMKELGLEPDVHTYNSLLNAFSDAPYEVLLKTYEDMLKRKVSPNRRTYNSLMLACQKMGDYERAFQLFEELKRDGLTPDVTTYNLLFVMCRDRLDFVLGIGVHSNLRRNREQREVGMKAVAELAMALLVEMEECSILPNTFTYNALLGVLGRCHDVRVFELFEQMKTDNRSATAPNLADDLMLTWLGNASSTGAALPKLLPPLRAESGIEDQLEGWVAGKGVCANLDTYSTMIDAAKRLGAFDKALHFYNELKARAVSFASGKGGYLPGGSYNSNHPLASSSSALLGPNSAAAAIKPTKAVFQLVLEVCALKQDKARGYAVYQDARNFDIQIDVEFMNALLNVIAECGDPSILDELENMKRDKDGFNIRPDIDSYNVCLKGCVKLGSVQDAMNLFNELCDPQCPLPGPNAVTFSTLFDLCTQNRDIPTATNLFAVMKKRLTSAPAKTYCRYLNVFVSAGDPGAVEVFEDMRRYGPQPDLDAYCLLLTYYLQRKDAAIIALFDDMKTRAGLEPDIKAFNVVMDYAGMKQDHNRALRYFEELKTRGLSPDVETFNALIKCFAPSGSSMVHKIFEEMADSRVAPDHVTFSILMQHKAGCSSLATALEQRLVYVKPPTQDDDDASRGDHVPRRITDVRGE